MPSLASFCFVLVTLTYAVVVLAVAAPGPAVLLLATTLALMVGGRPLGTALRSAPAVLQPAVRLLLRPGAFGPIWAASYIVRTAQGTGSGIAITKRLVLSCQHVVGKEGRVRLLSFDGGAEIEAEVIASDPVRDLALLRPQIRLPTHVTCRDADAEARLGEAIVVAAAPLGKPRLHLGALAGDESSAESGRPGSEGLLLLDVATAAGSSGGGVVAGGTLLGVIVGQLVNAKGVPVPGHTLAISYRTISAFLNGKESTE